MQCVLAGHKGVNEVTGKSIKKPYFCGTSTNIRASINFEQ